MKSPLHVLAVLGTRPEAIKLAPVILAMQQEKSIRCSVISTGQHREMLTPMLDLFSIVPDEDLDLQRPGQSLEHIQIRILEKLPAILQGYAPDVLMVQGDTTTAFMAALCAFQRGIAVAHLEAGLRTPTPSIPFPEEMNRRLTARIARIHLAPTARASRALAGEGVDPRQIHITGNSVIDALRWLQEERPTLLDESFPAELKGRLEENTPLILVTGHRRESFGEPMRQFCQGLRTIVEEHSGFHLVYPVHLNPQVQKPVHELLDGHPRIHLLEPVEYPAMLALMRRARLIITDSGGIQEEAPSFGIPVLVTRETTERMEAVETGWATLVGTDPAIMVEEARRRLQQELPPAGPNPFGDGQASSRVVRILLEDFKEN